jgi:ankyrin repeat protein
MELTVSGLLKQAIKDDREDILFYILNASPMCSFPAFEYAVERNNLDLLKKISELKNFHINSVDHPRIFMNTAVKNNNLDMVKFLIEKCIYRIEDFKYWSPINIAVYNAGKYPETHREMLDYILRYNNPLTANTLIQAALGENREIIDLLVKHGAQNQIHLI